MQEILAFLLRPELPAAFTFLKVILGAAGILMFLGIVTLIVRTSWLNFAILYDTTEFITFQPFGVRRRAKQWKTIVARLETGREAEYKLALLEADRMFEEVIDRMGLSAPTFAGKMDQIASSMMPNAAAVKRAHQVRDSIVHDPDYALSLETARKALSAYEEAFRHLDLL